MNNFYEYSLHNLNIFLTLKINSANHSNILVLSPYYLFSLSDKHGSTSVEVYEKAEVKHGDKQCHKFIMKLQSCPQQCVR